MRRSYRIARGPEEVHVSGYTAKAAVQKYSHEKQLRVGSVVKVFDNKLGRWTRFRVGTDPRNVEPLGAVGVG